MLVPDHWRKQFEGEFDVKVLYIFFQPMVASKNPKENLGWTQQDLDDLEMLVCDEHLKEWLDYYNNSQKIIERKKTERKRQPGPYITLRIRREDALYLDTILGHHSDGGRYNIHGDIFVSQTTAVNNIIDVLKKELGVAPRSKVSMNSEGGKANDKT